MDVEELVRRVKGYRGVTRKALISHVACQLLPASVGKVIASAGEDAAALECGDTILLLAADGILEDLVAKDPFWAGYCAVLVNVNDVAAMGGEPLAMVNVLSCRDAATRAAIVEGIREACQKFGVPMVGGHLHPDTTYTAIDVAILGKTDREHLVLSSGAKAGDAVVFAMDLDGAFTPGVPYSWDTTSRKSGEKVRRQLGVMRRLAGKVTAGKDISNPGCLGTLGMLLEASEKGAVVDVAKIPIPSGADVVQWLQAYQGCGFVLTCRPRSAGAVRRVFQSEGIACGVCGTVTDGSSLELLWGGGRAVLFDFAKESLGCSPPQRI